MLRRTTLAHFATTAVLYKPILIKMPALSPTMETGVLTEWAAKIGDKLVQDTTICKVQTDKAVNDFNHVGDECYLARLLHEAGATVAVGQPVALAVDEPEDLGSDEIKNWQPPAPKKKPAAAAAAPAAAPKTKPTAAATPSKKTPAADNSKLAATLERSGPAVVRLAAALPASDLAAFVAKRAPQGGSGLGGRFIKADLLKAFPGADFEAPSPDSPFAHTGAMPVREDASGGDAAKRAPSSGGAGDAKKKDVAGYTIASVMQPGAVHDFKVRDDHVLAWLINHS